VPRIAARRICVVRTSALGDVVHALAMVNGLRGGYPEAHITWVLHPLGHEVVCRQREVDRFVVFPRHGGIAGWRRLAGELRAERFELAITPQVSAKAGLVTALLDAEVKLGFDWWRSRELHWWVTTHHIPHRPPGHVQDAYLEFLDWLEIPRGEPRWDLVFTQEELAWREEFYARLGRPAVAFVVASSRPVKDWQPDGYARVMEHVHGALGLQPLIVGGPSPRERAAAESIIGRCRAPVVAALERPVRPMLLRLSGAAVVVAPDTGPLHAAVALGVPTVGLYGASDPRRCGPYHRFADLLVDRYNEPGHEHAPIRRTLRRGRMAAITPHQVIEKVELALARYPREVGKPARRGEERE
jgi:heptosyltransferase I